VTGGRVIVVGSLNEDVVLRVDRAPHPGETVSATSVHRSPGGKGANQAVAAARAGAWVEILGRVGSDRAGQCQLEALREAGVDTSLTKELDEVATGAAYITVSAAGENTIVIDPGANARLVPEDVDAAREAIARADVMLAQLEVPLPTVTRAITLARRGATRAVVTLSPAQPVGDELLDGLDPLLVNQHEAAILLGEGEGQDVDPRMRAERLRGRGPRSVVVTLGADGAILADVHEVRHLPAHPVQTVRDTTGAGDAFAGALGAALAVGCSLAEAVGAGLAAGAEAVTRDSAR
jgi:ribokinase